MDINKSFFLQTQQFNIVTQVQKVVHPGGVGKGECFKKQGLTGGHAAVHRGEWIIIDKECNCNRGIKNSLSHLAGENVVLESYRAKSPLQAPPTPAIKTRGISSEVSKGTKDQIEIFFIVNYQRSGL